VRAPGIDEEDLRRNWPCLTASAGISYNKFLAKLASDHCKPNGQFVVTPAMAAAFVETLPIGKFHGVGPVTGVSWFLIIVAEQEIPSRPARYKLWKQRDSPSTVACVLPSLSSVRGALEWLKMPELTVSFGGGLTPHRAFLEPRS
jgi:hypothetical protein